MSQEPLTIDVDATRNGLSSTVVGGWWVVAGIGQPCTMSQEPLTIDVDAARNGLWSNGHW
jgi:hypothetical protein